jgi:hypothetical protein
MDAEQKQLLDRAFRAEAELWGDRPILWQMDLCTAIATCAHLQLALRHSDFAKSPSANQVRTFIMTFQDGIPDSFPTLKRMIGLGFHSRFDVPREYSTEEQFRQLLKSALSALRSYQFGNSSPELAEEIADKIESVIGPPEII